MNPYDLLNEYYPEGSLAAAFLIPHSEAVASFALSVGERVDGVDLVFLKEAALLHDIGILHTYAPTIGCEGKEPYICHGILGDQLLSGLGYKRYGRVCKSHVGVALTAEYIRASNLPLPAEDMVPLTIEEEIIAYADKFFSKRKEWLTKAKPVDTVLKELRRFGEEPAQTFLKWHERYA